MHALISAKGFTFVEVLIGAALLAVIASAMSLWYVSGYQSLDGRGADMLLTSRLRSLMEDFAGTPFDLLANGSGAVTVNGQTYTITWTTTPVDLNGDGVSEPDARLVDAKVSGLPSLSLSSILVNHEGQGKKIP